MRELDVPDDATLVLAVSGGADSVALLRGAAQLVASGRRAWRLTVAHLDHQLRPESADDADAVRAMAAELRLPVAIGRTDVAALATAEGRSVEDAGRAARYRFLATIAGDGWVATAHTFDDSVETVLLNLLRGAGLGGVGGIPARRGRIVRPLLHERRAELRTLLDDAGLPYRDDASNADPAYLRNRVRAELLPMLEAVRPGAVEAIGRFASLAAEDDALLDAVAAIERSRRTDPDGAIDWRVAPERAIGRRVVRQAIGEPAPSAERIEALLAAAEAGRGGTIIELGGGRRATIRDRRIRIDQ